MTRGSDSRRRTTVEAGADALWKRVRREYLAAHPLCELCAAEQKTVPATVVHHRIPKAKRPDLRLEWSNLQGLCKHHHDSDAQQADQLGYSRRVGPDGYPVDPRHPFYGKGGRQQDR